MARKKKISIYLFEGDRVDEYLLTSLLNEIDEVEFNVEMITDLDNEHYDCELLLLDIGKDKNLNTKFFKRLNLIANNIPIVVLSDIDDSEFSIQVMKIGVQDYLVKHQLTSQLLYHSIRYAIERYKFSSDYKEIEKFKIISEKITDGIMITDQNEEIVFCNQALKKIFPKKDRYQIPLEKEIKVKSRIYEVNKTSIHWDSLHPNCELIYFKDITEKKKIERLNKINEAKYQSLFENLSDGFIYGRYMTNKNDGVSDLLILELNKKLQNMLMNQDVMNKKLSDLVKETPSWLQEFNPVVKGREVRFVYYLEENRRWYSVLAYPITNDYFAAIVRDITEQKESEKELEYFSTHDALTSLYNRSFYEQEKIRLKDTVPISFVICDIDGLKIINDTLGHEVGDKVITKTAEILKDSFRKDDVICRMGGDEFLLILPFVTEENIKKMIERFENKIKDYNDKKEYYISVSVGYAIRKTTDQSLDHLFREADELMYAKKIHRKESSRSSIIKTLHYALIQRDFKKEKDVDQVKKIVKAFSKAIEYDHNILDLQLLAQFHDIGKVGIPDAILFKPGKLTDEEWRIMKSHVEIGYQIAESTAELKNIAKWVLLHHEQWDGNGYPKGLKQEEIPLECRIISIIDAYDAMIHDRPYRKALTKEDALSEVIKGKATKFDPNLVDVFIKIIK